MVARLGTVDGQARSPDRLAGCSHGRPQGVAVAESACHASQERPGKGVTGTGYLDRAGTRRPSETTTADKQAGSLRVLRVANSAALTNTAAACGRKGTAAVIRSAALARWKSVLNASPSRARRPRTAGTSRGRRQHTWCKLCWPIAARQWLVSDSAAPKEQSILTSVPAAV